MTPFSQLSINEFRSSLTTEMLRPLQIIQIALGTGPLVFFGMVLLVASTTPEIPAEEADTGLLVPLTGIALIVFSTMLTVGRILFQSRFNKDALRGAESRLPISAEGDLLHDSPAVRALAVIREAMLIRGAVTEGSAFLGLAVMIIAATGGVLFSIPWLWLNAIPLAANTLYIIMTFPTADRLTALFEQKFKQR